MSIKIRLSNVEHIPYHMAAQVSSSLTNIVNVYTRGGLNARVALMDMDFKKVSDYLELVQVNTTATRYHVGEIERGIRVVE